MSFRLVSKSVTLNDLERCNGQVHCAFCVISPNFRVRCRRKTIVWPTSGLKFTFDIL